MNIRHSLVKWLLGSPRAEYDAVRFTPNRPLPKRDKGDESQTYRPFERMKAISLGRDLHRNSPKFATLERQLAIMTASVVKANVNTSDSAWNAEAGQYFAKWAKDVLLRIGKVHLSELCQQITTALMREGDILVAYDHDITSSGKLLVYEADQLCNMSADDFARTFPDYFQQAGVVYDSLGIVRGYIVSSVNVCDGQRPNGLDTLPADKCLVLTTDDAVLIANRYRPTQLRGVPEYLAMATALRDADEIVKSELLTAKRMAKQYNILSMGESTSAQQSESELLQRLQGVNLSDLQNTSRERTHYQAVDEDESAITTYLDSGDHLEVVAPTRPNLDTIDFYTSVQALASASLGLSKSYGELHTSNSYSGARFEALQTWASIYERQKRLERSFLDWLAVKVISHGIERGYVSKPTAPWQDKISWTMPTQPAIDENVQVNATTSALRAGLTTYRETLGADWESKLAELGSEIKRIRDLGIPLDILQTVSGQVVEDTSKENEQ